METSWECEYEPAESTVFEKIRAHRLLAVRLADGEAAAALARYQATMRALHDASSGVPMATKAEKKATPLEKKAPKSYYKPRATLSPQKLAEERAKDNAYKKKRRDAKKAAAAVIPK